jgi:hypothetical protein
MEKKTENFSISMPSYLIEQMNSLCELHDWNVSKFVTRAVRNHIYQCLDKYMGNDFREAVYDFSMDKPR